MSIAEKIAAIQINTDLAYGSGYRAGQADGVNRGYQNGYEVGGRDGFQQGHAQGLIQGREDASLQFWRRYQQNGERSNYQSAFLGFGFDFDNFYPLFDICPTGSCSTIFYGWNWMEAQKGSLKERLQQCGVKLNTAYATNLSQAFHNSFFTELPAVTLPGGVANRQIFASNPYLVSIERVIVEQNTEFNNCFSETRALEKVIFTGVIGRSGLDVSDCKKLSHSSVQSILDCLQDYSGSHETHTVVLGAENLAKLTLQQRETALAKGWNLL